MSLFSKILNEKLKNQQVVAVEESNSPTFQNIEGLSEQLLAWFNDSKINQKSYYRVEDSSYSIYKKDPKVIEAAKLQREKLEFQAFLREFSSEKMKEAVQFFYAQGARSFMSFSGADLKRDFKRLAFKLHPDRHFNESPSVQRQFQEDFRVLSESYDLLKMHFSSAK